MQKNGGGGAAAAPTGCFKCGRPGHWSRDCPSSGPGNANANANPKSGPFPPRPPNQSSANAPGSGGETPASAPVKTRKPPKTRPKLTPDMLLSDDGLGYVLKHFPRAVTYRGRGHEAEDLGNLVSLYAQWHKRLIPYYSFNQFIKKVEQLGTSKRVKMCIRELKERVANGGDPTKLQERSSALIDEDNGNEMDAQNPASNTEDPPFDDQVVDDVPEDLFDEIYQNATEEMPQRMDGQTSGDVTAAVADANAAVVPAVPSAQGPKDGSTDTPSSIQLTDDQKARIEANRLKALERAAARARALQVEAS